MALDLKPDLILMDIVLGGSWDGIDAVEKMRASGQNIPVVFLTAHADEALIERAKKVAPLGYILKPFQDWQINAAVEVALHKMELERELQRTLGNMEVQVKTRTKELTDTNRDLKKEIEKSRKALKLLKDREKELADITFDLREANIALEILLAKRDRDRQELIDKLMLNLRELVVPYIEKLKLTELSNKQETFIDIIQSSLEESTMPIAKGMSDEYLKLTPTEIQVANLLRQGKSTKDIAEIMGLSPRTVESYRDSIRKKFGLRHKKINLRTYLMSRH
jgi:DNA-binding NarL/FixJ family response regulator